MVLEPLLSAHSSTNSRQTVLSQRGSYAHGDAAFGVILNCCLCGVRSMMTSGKDYLDRHY